MSRRRGLSNGVTIILACFLGVTMAACSDDDDDAASDIAISGRVLDAQGQPVAGAGILIDYTAVPGLQAFALPYPIDTEPIPEVIPAAVGDSTCVDVSDWCGNPVARLSCEGNQVCAWDRYDNDGLVVPPGLYRLNPYDCESFDPYAERLIFVDHENIGSVLNDGTRPLAVTDADGRFAIPRCLIPLGERFNCTVGEPGEPCEIDADITVYAWKGNDRGSIGATVGTTGTVTAAIQFEEQD